MYKIYKIAASFSAPILSYILKKRQKLGKEHFSRFIEKKGIINIPRPKGKLIWIHAASVGEAQSSLIIIKKLLEENKDLFIIITTGTLTSANLMEQKLPENAFHQFYPLDHPKWVLIFLKHWQPNYILWMESELWPNMLHEIKKAKIPSILINAHMSEKSFNSWKRFPNTARKILQTFDKILCQTEKDYVYFKQLGISNIKITDNIKYSASPLNYNDNDLIFLQKEIESRPIWLYASTHKGEEKIACEIHIKLKKYYPNLLTIIIPRHPERRDEIKDICSDFDINICFRGENKTIPNIENDVYIVDTLGELGLFYSLSEIAVIGRSLSDDGGGGHNPIEAAQLNCAILHGCNIQNLQDIFDEMNKEKAAISINNKIELLDKLKLLFKHEEKIKELQKSALNYATKKNKVIDNIMHEINSIFK